MLKIIIRSLISELLASVNELFLSQNYICKTIPEFERQNILWVIDKSFYPLFVH
jgi:hypothetical protein